MKKIIIFPLSFLLILGALWVNFESAIEPEKSNSSLNKNANTVSPENKPKELKESFPEIVIEITDGAFSKTNFEIKKGVATKITVINNGSDTHDFFSEIFKTGPLKPGESFSETITANEAGDYDFICEITGCPGHKKMQKGYKFVVV